MSMHRSRIFLSWSAGQLVEKVLAIVLSTPLILQRVSNGLFQGKL